MNAKIIEHRLRTFLLLLSGFICLGIPVELWLTEHFQEPLQFIPFILCAVGFVAITAVLFYPQRTTITALRGVMAITAVGGLFGMVEHIEENMGFIAEIQPNLTGTAALMEALKGAAPLFAPGILGVVALMAIAATYYHPVLGGRREN